MEHWRNCAFATKIATRAPRAWMPDGGLFEPDAGAPVGGGECDKTHKKVGWYADLETYAHGVKGRATISDDKNFVSGFPIGGQLYRPGQPYVNVTMDMGLPKGRTLHELDSVSVWCVAARHNFGDGTFRAP